MADPISVCASIVGIAGFGFNVSKGLYFYAESISRAGSDITDTARDIRLTSSVLEELGAVMQREARGKVCSDRAINTADKAVSDCNKVFKEVNDTLDGYRRNKEDGTKAVKWFKPKWPLS